MFSTPVLRLGAVAAAAVLSLGVTSGAQADDTMITTGPCATQEAQLAKAEAALLKVNSGKAKEKKAQMQRLAKAEARLAKCVAAQPV